VTIGRRSIALVPAALFAVVIATAAVAATVALTRADPTALFDSNPAYGGRGQTVIASTVRRIDTFKVPGVGDMQYWMANTKQHGLCQALRRPDGTWAGFADHGTGAGEVPGCAATREQIVKAYEARPDGRAGLGPMPVDEHDVSIRDARGRWRVIYYGIVSAEGATGVKDPSTGNTVPLIDGRYFVLVAPPTPMGATKCLGCDNLQAVNARGKVLSANYRPTDQRNN
jgi:hypothetical protein